MTETQRKLLSERNIALQEVVKAVKECNGKRAIEVCRKVIEWTSRFYRNKSPSAQTDCGTVEFYRSYAETRRDSRCCVQHRRVKRIINKC